MRRSSVPRSDALRPRALGASGLSVCLVSLAGVGGARSERDTRFAGHTARYFNSSSTSDGTSAGVTSVVAAGA